MEEKLWSEKEVTNISDVFFICIKHGEGHYVDRLDAHHLKYVVQGGMTVFDGDREIEVRAGQSVFLRKDHRMKFRKYPIDEEPFRCITFEFKRDFLRKYYNELGFSTLRDKRIKGFKTNCISLTEIPSVKGLFMSMLPYLVSETEPPESIMQLKLREGVQTLITTDERFYPILFDFADDWKIDILDFLNENYHYNFSMKELANYTGRSLATFKRDFAKISDLTPEKWIMNKRLDEAYSLLQNGGENVREVMETVGFKNPSHFTKAFKDKFGMPPSEIIKTKK